MVDGEFYDVYAPTECFVPFFLRFFSSPKRSLKRSSRMTLEWCFLGRRNRGSVLRLAKRVSDMEGAVRGEVGIQSELVQVGSFVKSSPMRLSTARCTLVLLWFAHSTHITITERQ